MRFVSRDAVVQAVNGVSFTLEERETLCILGESGSGKSVTLRALMRLNPAGRTVMGGRSGSAGTTWWRRPSGSWRTFGEGSCR